MARRTAPGAPTWQGRLLDLLQDEFPARPRPYAELARRLGGEADGGHPSEEEVLAAVESLRASGLVRRLGGVFDSQALGLVTTLVAAEVPEGRLDSVAALVSAYPEVTHNYAREGRLNLWFTLAAPDRRRIAEILAALEAATGLRFHDLPAQRVFKREVKFRFGGLAAKGTGTAGCEAGGPAGEPQTARERDTAGEPDTVDRQLIAVLQGDLPGGARPFTVIARDLETTEEEVLARIELYRRKGWLRRLAAVVAHRRAGIEGNAMVAWEIPERGDRSSVEAAGRTLAAFPSVSHCYARPPLEGWPYRLYTMVHAATREQAQAEVARLAAATGLGSYQVLFSTREYKKTSPRYF